MKKMSFILGISFVLAQMCGVVAGHAYEENFPPSDAEIANAYLVEEYGEGDYEIEFLDFDSEFDLVYFTAYENGEEVYFGGINMDHYAYLVE